MLYRSHKVGGGAEVMGAADELARKAVPITSAP